MTDGEPDEFTLRNGIRTIYKAGGVVGMTKVIVVDDHAMVRQGVVSFLKTIEDLEVVGEVATGMAAIKLALDLRPDIIIMDMLLPDIDGIKTARAMKRNDLKSEIIFLTMCDDTVTYETALSIGAKGYILKNDPMEELLYAIKAVLRGERFASSCLGSSASPKRISPEGYLFDELTEREIEIVTLIAEGLSSREIGEKLFISAKTAQKHRANIMTKLGFRRSQEIIKLAFRCGLIK